LYAPSAIVRWQAPTTVFGSIFAGSFETNAQFLLRYDRRVVTIGDEECGQGGSGGAANTCVTCADCNNQACVNGTCGSCSSNADCCAPLECVAGTCVSPVVP
jgi:hypothetical protein